MSVLKIIALALLCVIVLAGIFAFAAMKKVMASMGLGDGQPVADYEKRIVIWEYPAGSSTENKRDHMKINEKEKLLPATLKFAQGIVGETYRDIEQDVDTFTWLYEISRGYEKETYEDQPYLIPYPAREGDQAVIVIPGGGYGYKSMDGTTGEGKDVAETLQKEGINAFVLHYRANPYEYPIPQLDVQRAVRYLRFHADELGIDPQKISLIGFSAGGTQVGSFLHLTQGKDLFPEGYEPDAVDGMDDFVEKSAMIYPCLTFRYNVSMLYCLFDDQAVRSDQTREELLKLMDLKQYPLPESAKTFVAYSTGDQMVDCRGTKAYVEAQKQQEARITVREVDGQPHGFGQEYYMEDYLRWLRENQE